MEHLVETTEGAALISGDESRHPATVPHGPYLLFDEQPGDGLHAGEQHGAGARAISVVEVVGKSFALPDYGLGHCVPPVLRRGVRLCLRHFDRVIWYSNS